MECKLLNVKSTTLPSRLIVFDGVCNFCNASINFIIKRDPQAKFTFTTVQSDTGRNLLVDLSIDPRDPNTLVLVKNGEVFEKSSAALEIAKELSAWWPVAHYLSYIPIDFRDWLYSLVANNRYRLMGKRDSCVIPSADVRARFID